MFKRILVPLDGSTRAARAVHVAARIAGTTHGTIILACVVNHFVLSPHPQVGQNRRIWANDDISISEADAYLNKIACALASSDVTVEKAILSGPVTSTLLSAATSYRADLIVLTSHGRSGMMSKTLGSVAEAIVGRATIPVLLLRENSRLPLLPYNEMYASV